MIDYAGKYLKTYESKRYTFLEKMRWLPSLTVPNDAEEFADLSFWQQGINWDTYKQHARAVVLRIGQNVWKDIEFENNYAQAKRRGIAIGAYHFFDGRVTPEAQAEMILLAMQGKTLEMELFIDFERDFGGAYEGLRNAVKLMKLLAGVKCKAIGFYTGYYYFVEHSNATTHAAEFAYLKDKPLWIAWYAAAALVKVPPPWTDWTHWQDGTPKLDWGQPTLEIDHDTHNGTKAQFEARYLGGDELPSPPIGEPMTTWRCKINGLAYRNGNGASYPQIDTLYTGDIVEGVLSGWIHGSKITRANGTVVIKDGWCSSNTLYMEPVVVTPPPSDFAADVRFTLPAGTPYVLTINEVERARGEA